MLAGYQETRIESKANQARIYFEIKALFRKGPNFFKGAKHTNVMLLSDVRLRRIRFTMLESLFTRRYDQKITWLCIESF